MAYTPFTKQERKIAVEVIRTGILRRHREWLEEIVNFINNADMEKNNEFDISMQVTRKSRDFYKEAVNMEQFYRNTMMDIGIEALLHDGYLNESDLAAFSPERIEWLMSRAKD